MPDEVKGQKVTTVLKWILGVGAAALATPVIFLALQGVLGLLAIGVAAGVGLAMIRLAPWFSQMLTNVGLKLFMREVAKNPIESMISLFSEKTQEAEEADSKIVEFDSEIRNYDDQVKIFSIQYPEEADSFQNISKQMHDALESMKEEQENIIKGLADLKARIAKAEAIYKMSAAAQNVAKLSKSAEQKVFQDIKEKVAFDSVQMELNRASASLNMALSRRKSLQASNVVPMHKVEEAKPTEPAQKTIGRVKA